ncbi:hypothetical protein MIR68_001961 [Amoeboaphelidium protococcarum]|nr:hypothetical protein MIR68_001961 [Amoeboaphelidium protococcarum]
MGEWKQLKIGNGEDIAAFVKNLSQSQTVAPGDSISLLVQSASASALKQELLFNGFQNLESADGTGKDQTLVTAIRSQVSQGGARPLKLARKHVEAKPITEDNNNDDLIDESALIDEADYVKHLRIHSELIVRPRRRLVKIAPVDVLKRNCYVQSLRGLNGTLTMKFNSSNQNNSCDCSCRHLRKYKVSTYANQGSKKVFYSQSKAVPAEKTPSPANKFNDAFVSPDHLLRLNRNANQPQPNKGDVVEQMADLDLEELRNHDVFDFMWEDTAPDTGEQIVKKQKRNKKEKKASLFKVPATMSSILRSTIMTLLSECSACDKASSEVRCLTCDNCPQFCDACFVQMHRDKQFHLQQRLQSNQLAYKCGGSLSAFCVDLICKKSKHSVKLYQFPNGVADCEIDVCEHITSVKYGLFKALLALGYVACTASKPQYAIQLEVIKFYASLLRNSKCTASGFAASFSDVCYIGGSSYFRKHLLQSLRLYIALEKQFWKTHNLPFQFDCLACPNQVAAQYTSKIADIKDGELQADTGLTDEMLDMSIALSQAQLPQIPHLLQIALDGNFKLNHLNRGASSGDVNNTVVISDKLFFVDSLCFDLLKDEYKQQSSSCSSFKAVTQVAGQLMSKFNDITGLFGACCARHGPAISRTYSNFEKVGGELGAQD